MEMHDFPENGTSRGNITITHGIVPCDAQGERTPVYEDGNKTPKCYGTFKKGRRCDCQFAASCRAYTFFDVGEKSQDRKWTNYQTVPLEEGMDWSEEENLASLQRSPFTLPNGDELDVSEVNLELIQILVWFALENPKAAEALMLKIDPKIRSLEDIANKLNVTRQAVQKRVANELGIGKKNFKDSTYLQLNGVEFDVFKYAREHECSIGMLAKKMKMPKTSVYRIVTKLQKIGLLKKQKNSGIFCRNDFRA